MSVHFPYANGWQMKEMALTERQVSSSGPWHQVLAGMTATDWGDVLCDILVVLLWLNRDQSVHEKKSKYQP